MSNMDFGADGHFGAASRPDALSAGAGSLGRGGIAVAQQPTGGQNVYAHAAVHDPSPTTFSGGTGNGVRGLNGDDNQHRAAKRLRFDSDDEDEEGYHNDAWRPRAEMVDGPEASADDSDVGGGGTPSDEGYSGEAGPGLRTLLGADSRWAEPGLEADELQYHEHGGGVAAGSGGNGAWHGQQGLSDDHSPSSDELEEADEDGGSDSDADRCSDDPEEDGGSGDPLTTTRAHVAPTAAPELAGPSAAARSIPGVTTGLGGGGMWTLLTREACQVPTTARKWFSAAPAAGSSRAVPVYGRRVDGSQTGPYTVQLWSDWQLTGLEELGQDLGAGEGYRLWLAWEMVQGAGAGAAGGAFGVVFANGGPCHAEAGEGAAAARRGVGGAASGAMRAAAAAAESREDHMGDMGAHRGRPEQTWSQGAGQKR